MINESEETWKCVCGGLLYRDGRILLGKRAATRASYPNVWDLPGGHREPGESFAQTLIREIEEELGITLTAFAPLATISIRRSVVEVELHVYLVTDWDGKAWNRQPEEHDVIRWFTIDEACRLPLASPRYPSLFRSHGPAVS